MKLGEFVTLQRGHDLTASEQRPGNVPVMGSAGMNGTHDTARAKGPGVVVGRSGASFGQAHFCTTNFWPHNTALYVTDFRGNDPRFTYYLLKSLDFSGYNSGSAQQSLNRNFVYPMIIEVPAPDEQRAIARVLGALDDKIELNRRMNRTLEELAGALFRAWFVDFEPVVAKAAGRAPFGLAPAVAALFPATFTDSELGPIPQGWKAGMLGDVIELAYGKALKEEARRPGNVPVFGSKGIVGWHDEALASGPGIVVGRKGNAGAVTWSHTEFFAIDTTFFVKPRLPLPMHYLFYELLQRQDFDQISGDSAVPGLSREAAYRNHTLIPSSNVTSAFADIVKPWFEQVAHNVRESRTLAALRNTLLPKLLSGELRVKNAETAA
jgi:type I restriction enzyme S subunit